MAERRKDVTSALACELRQDRWPGPRSLHQWKLPGGQRVWGLWPVSSCHLLLFLFWFLTQQDPAVAPTRHFCFPGNSCGWQRTQPPPRPNLLPGTRRGSPCPRLPPAGRCSAPRAPDGETGGKPPGSPRRGRGFQPPKDSPRGSMSQLVSAPLESPRPASVGFRRTECERQAAAAGEQASSTGRSQPYSDETRDALESG